MKIPKALTQVFHLTPSDSFSQFWGEPIHIASVFATLSFSPETILQNNQAIQTKLVQNLNLIKTTVVSSANCSSLVSKSFIFIPLISSWFRITIARISTAEKCYPSGEFCRVNDFLSNSDIFPPAIF